MQNKFLKMVEEFKEAYENKNWFHAKYLWDSICRIGPFIELPPEIRIPILGGGEEDEDNPTCMELMKMSHKAIEECTIKDNLGFECVVYRIPGEIGYHGAKFSSGTYQMPAEENPSFTARGIT